MLAATALALLTAFDSRMPCVDSLEALNTGFWFEESWGSPSLEPCDLDEVLLFPPEAEDASRGARAVRDTERASLSLARTPGGTFSTTRHQARRGAWSHRLEAGGQGGRTDLARRELAWSGGDWKVAGGDLDGEDFPVGARGFPRRALPVGWKASRRDDLSGLASPRPQGLAAGVFRRRWQAHALRAWNPVESGREPAWAEAWALSHAAGGLSVSLPWIAGLQVLETRVSRGDVDSISERLLAVHLATPREHWAVDAAISETRASADPGLALGLEGRHVFAGSARGPNRSRAQVRGSLRQRSAAWVSAWDPAVAKDAVPGRGAWGAGEYRLASTLPLRSDLSLGAEHWRSWNPPSNAWRRGLRLRAERRFERLEDFRLDLGGTLRDARAASGSLSVYRALEAQGRIADNPHWHAKTWRAWNAAGPLATGWLLGAEPEWRALKSEASLRVETDRKDRLKIATSGGLRWNFARGWSLDAGGTWPWGRAPAQQARGRVTVSFNASTQVERATESSAEAVE